MMKPWVQETCPPLEGLSDIAVRYMVKRTTSQATGETSLGAWVGLAFSAEQIGQQTPNHSRRAVGQSPA